MPGVVIALLGAGVIGYALFSPYRVVVGFRKGRPYALTVRSVGHLTNGDRAWLELRTADAFEGLKRASYAAGVDLRISSAFRSWEEQAAMKAKRLIFGGPVTADPGYSNHQQGTTVDLDVNGSDGGRVRVFLDQNATSYGFYRTVPSENWHYEFTAANA